MSTAAGAALSNAGLTVLSEDEEMFRASVREFAEGEVRPKVEQMEHAYAQSGDREKAVETYRRGIDVSMAHGHPSMANEYKMTLDLDFESETI